jgi:acetolactate synthase-1/2/3 large subunit
VNDLARIVHEAFYIAASGRPGPVVIDIPKDVQFASGTYVAPSSSTIAHKSYKPRKQADSASVQQMVDMMASAKRPLFYTGGGVINSGPKASQALRELVRLTGFPITSTLMGLGAYPASDKQWLGMLGMHGTYEANMAMYGCDVMINIGARFDDRITGKVSEFSPGSRKIHVDIDPSSINKNIKVDLPVVGDAGYVLEDVLRLWRLKAPSLDRAAHKSWWKSIDGWRARQCLKYKPSADFIMPQFALQRLAEAVKDRDSYITTDVGQHQMWAAQFLPFNEPNRWMTSGGLGTMGYGLPAAIGTQLAHPRSTVVCVSGDASILMNIQEMSTAVQYRAPVKIVILNNQYMGMVRQWQQLLHGNRLSESYTEALPDFVKLAEAYGAVGMRCDKPAELDQAFAEMLKVNRPVLFDCRVATLANCFPMIPSGKAHNEMLMGEDVSDEEVGSAIGSEGKTLV